MHCHKQVHRATLAGLCTLIALATAAAVVAKPPQGKGGKSGPKCVQFTGDIYASGDGSNPYCHKKNKGREVTFSQAPHHLTIRDTKNGGSRIDVNFNTDVDGILSTSEAGDVTARIGVGDFQDDFDFFDPDGDGIDLEVGESGLANMFIRVSRPTDSLLIRLAPFPINNDRHCPSSDPVTVTYQGLDGDGNHNWIVATQGLIDGACISRGGEGEFLEENLLLEVQGVGLQPGHIALNFSFVVTAPAD